MAFFLKAASSLGLASMLTLLAGCASSAARTAHPASTPEEHYLATLTLDADSAPLHAEPSAASPVVATVSAGDRLLLLERRAGWLRVRSGSGLTGFVQPSALVASTCTADRAEPRVLEEPVFYFEKDGLQGVVVIEAELDAGGKVISTRVVSNSLGDPAFEQAAIADLVRIRFLPPTRDCKPLPFFYTFTREF